MFGWFGKKRSAEIINSLGGMRLDDAEVDVLFIVKNNVVTYINNASGHLFSIDDDGDEMLDGRVVKFIFSASLGRETIEIFVAFDEADAYTMFTMRAGMQERLDFVSRVIFEQFSRNNLGNTFSFSKNYATQYEYTFKLYQKNNRYFMVNNAQTQAYLICEDGIQRENVDLIKRQFWE